MRGDVEAEALAGPLDQGLELRVLERRPLAAAPADRVVVMLAAGVGRLEAGGAGDLHPMDEPEAGEDVERPVDAREADAAVAPAQLVVELLRAHEAALAGEQVEHLGAGAAGAVARVLELLACVPEPGPAVGHASMIVETGSQYRWARACSRASAARRLRPRLGGGPRLRRLRGSAPSGGRARDRRRHHDA